ncbi:ribonuclease P protein subunit p38 [Callorhinchus milii]|uniref:ribonuclease P protein subunit p38 n=1 Tax=Callorhinchus milii TaxID=7868 RepID=UPI000457445D|nr:ribonuclease P protein subunit p38 [Callorhinchus milii]XP_042188023.1 ribonuclease P protein subunit p38 [Callorhinchus milii]XP_042188024.1 ribonuclease P protein subunit p38 [Callorhinchus milii]XP_042188025.1 ribonuclease P protein subunit p38 [Callorhinchus milii]|eukprot:gi/632960769/ref/XP_007896381.1/ PREDICTED: ribonuclease P protein subunit p38 [Callorhinchus milii]
MEISAQVAKGGVRKARPPSAKTTFNNPYSIKWSPLAEGSMAFILEVLKNKFQQVGLYKIEPTHRPRKPRASKAPKNQNKQENSEKPEESQETVQIMETEQQQLQEGWTSKQFRKQLAIGINEVTRGLEKDELCLVLVCLSVKPALMTQHLIQLSVSRAVPACQVPRLSQTIAPVLGLKSTIALGFKRNAETFLQTIKAIITRVPRLDVPWIRPSKREETAEGIEPKEPIDASEMQQVESSSSAAVFSLSRKRKICEVASSEASLESSSTKSNESEVQLLPLVIKKVVPNPNKIRKTKKNKKNK